MLEIDKGVRALRGKFGPLYSQKLKVAFHQFHPIGLLEEWFKCKFWHLFKFNGCYRNKNGHQNRHKIEKLPFWAKFKAFQTDFSRIRYQHKRIPKKPFNILCAMIILTLC